MPVVLMGILSLALVASLVISVSFPIQNIMPDYWNLAVLLPIGKAHFDFVPVGYSALIADWLSIGQETYLRIIQLLFLWVTWFVSIWSLHNRHPSKPSCPFWMLLLLNPLFLVGIVRVSDNSINVLLIAVLYLALLFFERRERVASVLLGFILGYFALVRPNALSLLPVIFWRTFKGEGRFKNSILVILSLVFTFAIVSVLITNRFWFWPTNGGYNFFAGNNPFSMAELQTNYNAEYSLNGALGWCGLSENRYSVSQSDYTRCAFKFISLNPIEFVKLMFFKAYNLLFRPNFRLAQSIFQFLLHGVTLLPTLFWWSIFLLNKPFRQSRNGAISFFIIVFYAIPFVITNSNPRFRIPLDVIYSLSLLSYFNKSFVVDDAR